MAEAKLRVVYHEESGAVTSFFFLEKTEALRAIAILKMLPSFSAWTPLSKIAKKLKVSVLSVQSTILKLSGAKYIDILNNEEHQVIAERPVLLVFIVRRAEEKSSSSMDGRAWRHFAPTATRTDSWQRSVVAGMRCRDVPAGTRATPLWRT